MMRQLELCQGLGSWHREQQSAKAWARASLTCWRNSRKVSAPQRRQWWDRSMFEGWRGRLTGKPGTRGVGFCVFVSGWSCRLLALWPYFLQLPRTWPHRLAYFHLALIQFSRSVVSDSLWPRGLQYARLPCPSPTPGTCSNSCPSSRWCHPTISSSVIPFSHLQSFPALGSFPMSQFFASDGQSTGVSAMASVLPMNMQDWFPLGWTGWISLQSKGLSRVFSNTTVPKHQFFGTQLSL